MKEKRQEPEFVVTDRRKFTDAGDLRPDSGSQENRSEQKATEPQPAESKTQAQQAPPPAEQSTTASPDANKTARVEHLREAPPVTPAEHEAQGREYNEGNKRL